MFSLLFSLAHAEDAPPPAPPVAPEVTAELEAMRERIRQMEQQLDKVAGTDGPAPLEIPLDLETKLHGYADVQLKTYEGEPLTFKLGDLTLSYDANLDRKVTFHTDVLFAIENDAVQVHIDSMEIKVRPNDAIEFTAGRFYTPLSRWADNNFNGSFRYLTVLLPEVLLTEADEGSLPIHLVGLAADGRAPVGFWYLRYHLSVTNGRSATRGEVSQGFDNEWLKSPMVGLWLETPSGLVFGGASSYDYITPGETVEENELDRPIHEVNGSVSVDYTGRKLQVLAEGFVVHHVDDTNGDQVTNLNGYAQAGYRVGRTTPYLKVEHMERPYEDAYYRQMTEPKLEEKYAAGVRYDLGIHAALKLEVSYCMETEYEVEVEENGEIEIELEHENYPAVWAQFAAGF